MDVCGLSKARPILCNDSPAFQRRHTSVRCATESSTYFPCVIDTTSEGRFISGGVASSGDTGGANIYPSVSPFVVSAGGTSVNRDNSGNFVSETGWSGSGGGPSKYETKPTYQSGIAGTDATQRSAPDFSFDADPNTGVSVYDSTSCQGLSGWLVFGGTSVSSPSLAGNINSAGNNTNSTAELWDLYQNLSNNGYASNFYDITQGTAGSFSATIGWDRVTGL